MQNAQSLQNAQSVQSISQGPLFIVNPPVILAGAFAFVVGTAWNGAFQSLIKAYNPVADRSALTAQFTYAIIVTIMVIFLSYAIYKFAVVSAEIPSRIPVRIPAEIPLKIPIDMTYVA